MDNSTPVSLLASWPEQRHTLTSFVKVNNWYLSFDKTNAVSEINSAEDLQLREQMYKLILKKIGLA